MRVFSPPQWLLDLFHVITLEMTEDADIFGALSCGGEGAEFGVLGYTGGRMWGSVGPEPVVRVEPQRRAEVGARVLTPILAQLFKGQQSVPLSRSKDDFSVNRHWSDFMTGLVSVEF